MKWLHIHFFLFTVIVSLSLLFPKAAFALEESGQSAKIKPTEAPKQKDPKDKEIKTCTQMLSDYLTINGPVLAAYAATFAEEAIANDLDCTLVVAIAGNESAYGRRMAVPYNGWGWCGGRTCAFRSWEDAIHTVSTSLGEKYCKRWGACDPYTIGRHYAQDPLWAAKVTAHMQKIYAYSPAQPPKLSI